MKKLIAFLLCAVFCLSLASCGEKKDSKPKKAPTTASSSAVEETTSETKATEKSKSSSKAKKKKKKKSSKTSSKASKKTSSKTSSEPEYNSSSPAVKKSNSLESLICNSKGWKATDNGNQTIIVNFLSGGAIKMQVFNKKGVLVHNKMEYSAWRINGDKLTLSKAVSNASDIEYRYIFRRIRDSVLDSAPMEKANKKYINYVPLEYTGLKKDEFYVSQSYFCFYAGTDHGQEFCRVFRSK